MLAVLHDNFVLAKLILILLKLHEGILVVFFISPGSLVQFMNCDVSSLLALLKATMVCVHFYDMYAFMIFTVPVFVERNTRRPWMNAALE